ncbi:MAG: prephenate dehydratase domain-containing protein [Polyangiaceae bacterium]
MDPTSKQKELEARLAEIDLDLLRAIERRAKVVQDLVRHRHGAARFAPIAGGAHLAELERAVTPPFPASAVRPLFTAIDAASRVHEVAPRVICVGAEGDFGWMAARAHFGDSAEIVRSNDGPVAAIEEVARSRADFAVVSYESLKDGPLFPTIQAIANADLKLIGEREAVQALCLVNSSGDLADIRKVYASPLDHAACAQYLETHHGDIFVHDVRSPFVACDLAAAEPTSAAIVPRGCIRQGELRVARENIGDEGEIRIRYGIVGRLPAPRTGSDATALLFSVHDRPGALHAILAHFKERGCNLRRIQSRPVPGEGWEYVFYLEVGGHMTDRSLVAALEGVKREAKMLKILGSFPLEFPDPQPSSR